MSNITPGILALERAGIWVYRNPAETAVLAYALRYAPAKIGLVAIETAKYQAVIARPTLAYTARVGSIVLGARGVGAVKVASKAGIYGAAAAVGVGVGVVAGTAVSSAVFGPEGKDRAIQFYSGQANMIDYIPHYNAYKIVRHYATEAMAE
jgi:hypothetical protein